MGSDVSLKEPRSAKRLAADFTLARQRVCSDVHFKRSERHIKFIAVFTMERALVIWVAVVLLVAEQ